MSRDGRFPWVRAGALALVLAGSLLGSCAKTDDEWVEDLRSSDLFVRGLAAIAIAEQAPQRGEDAVQALLEVVDGRPGPLQGHARAALIALAPHVTDEVLRSLFDSTFVSAENRAALEDALVAVGASTVPAIAARFDGPSGEHARSIGSVLTKMGDAAIDPLLEVLRSDPRESARQAAAWQLGQCKPPARRAIPELLRALQSADPKLVRLAAECLSRIDRQGWLSLEALRGTLEHPDEEVRQAGREALAQVLSRRSAQSTPDERRALVDEALRLGDAALPAAVEAALDAREPRWRFGTEVLLACAARWMVEVLGSAHDPRRLEELEKQVEAGFLPSRGRAALELGRIGKPAVAAVPALVAACGDRHQGVRVCAGLGLALIAIDIAQRRLAPARR